MNANHRRERRKAVDRHQKSRRDQPGWFKETIKAGRPAVVSDPGLAGSGGQGEVHPG